MATRHTLLNVWSSLQDPKEVLSSGSFYIHLISFIFWIYARSVCSKSRIKRTENKKRQGETLKIYCALHAFYQATIIPMVRRSFSRAGFRFNPDNLLSLLVINRTEVPARINIPEMSLEQVVFQEPTETPTSDRRPRPRRARIPAAIEFAMSLKTYIDKRNGIILCVATEITRNHLKMKRDRKINSGLLICHVSTRF
jgi:hypothetical protein